jgi:hypothetical protein
MRVSGLVALAGLALVVGLGGCDRKDATLDLLSDTARTLHSAGGVGDASRKSFSEVTTTLAEVARNGDRSGATASLMISVSQLGLSDAEFQKYLASEAQCLAISDQIRSTLSQYLSLHAAAKGADSFSVAGEMGRINAERARNQDELAKARTERSNLDQQITTLRSDSTSRLAAANAKLADAAKVTENLARLSSAEGAAATQRAYDIKVEAEKDRRAGLELEAKASLLQPVLDEWTLKIGQYEHQLENLAGSEKSLQEQERLAKQSAADARSDAGNAAERIADLVRQAQELRAGPLEECTGKALATLKKAVDATRELAKPSGNPGQASLLTGMAQQAIGELQLSRASGYAAYGAMLQNLIEATPAMPAAADYASKAEAATKAQADASDAAKAAFEDAQRGFERASSTGPGEAATKAQLKALAARCQKLAGKASDSAADAAATPSSPTAAVAGSSASSAVDPEFRTALERFIAANKAGDVAAMLALRHFPDPAVREIVQSTSGMITSMMRLDNAMKAKFGKGLQEASGNAPGMDQLTAGFAKVSSKMKEYAPLSADSFQVTIDGDNATATASGVSKPATFKKVDGKWLVADAESDAAMSNPQAAAQLKAMSGLYAPMGTAAAEVAAEVEQGKHASAEAAMEALGMKLLPIMQKMMQGKGGG